LRLCRYPRLLPRISTGLAGIMEQHKTCARKGLPQAKIAVRCAFFVQVNGVGPFVRTVDPSVNLVEVQQALKRRGFLEVFWQSLIDTVPAGHEIILRGSGGRYTRAEANELAEKKRLFNRPAHLVIDRAACLAIAPLRLRPLGHAVNVAVVAAPRAITVTSCGANKGAKDNCNKQRLSPSGKKASFLNSTLVKALSMTISIAPTKGATSCADAPEDVVLSLVV